MKVEKKIENKFTLAGPLHRQLIFWGLEKERIERVPCALVI